MDRTGSRRRARRNTSDAVVIFYYVTLCLASLCGSGVSTCPEPPPVANAYRTLHADRVTYECFETYTLTRGNLSRSCDAGTYLGAPPLCILNCSSPREDPRATLLSLNDSLAFDSAIYECDEGFVGSVSSSIFCVNKLGSWNHSAINCHDPDGLPLNGTGVLEPSDPSADTDMAVDGSPATAVVLRPGSTLTFNMTDYGNKMEVTEVKLKVWANVTDTYMPCQLTNLGTEYVGKQKKVDGVLCQRWDSQTPHQHNLTDDSLFPGDGSATNASNYCRNPGSAQSGPWCYTENSDKLMGICRIWKACVQLGIETIYVDMDGVERTDHCSSSYQDNIHSLMNINDSPKQMTKVCRPPSSNAIPPFGHQIRISLEDTHINMELHLYEFQAFGREYIGGCGHILGFWRLELVGDPPVTSQPGTEVTYRCKAGYHYRGGNLISLCKDSRKWSAPDVSQCTDEFNHAATQGVEVRGSWQVVSQPLLNDDNLTTCVQSFGPSDPSTSISVNVSLASPLEVSEVLVTTRGNETYYIPLELDMVMAGRTWYCDRVNVGRGGTFVFQCPFRPVADTVVLRYERSSTGPPFPDWSLCEIKVFGRNLTVGLECFQCEKGQDYKGTWSMTASGLPCQRWDSDSPHRHPFNVSRLFPDPSISEAANYCRNPSHPDTNEAAQMRPWCYTMENGTEWEYCPLFKCNGICRLREDGLNYRGDIKRTVSGHNCVLWSSYDSREGSIVRSHYYSKDGDVWRSQCRNPHGSQSQPWCFNSTYHPELCHVPMCPLVTDNTMHVYLDPNNASSTPDWLQNSSLTGQCRRFSFDGSSSNTFYDLSVLLPSQCQDIHASIGVYCNFRNGSGASLWRYFWYNCSTDPEVTTQPSTETPSTEAPSTEALPTEEPLETCDCHEVCSFNVTAEELAASVQRIKAELLVDKSTLSATIRKKQSAKDSRPSAVTTGTFGIVLLAIFLTFVISSDVISVVQWFQNRMSKAKAAKISNESH